MKRFWLVLLALGMLFAFSSSVFAADVKFTGSYYAAGMYIDDLSVMKDNTGKPATAFYYQRLRVNMEFIATPALKLVTRFDALERIWGGPRSGAGVVPGVPYNLRWDYDSYGTRAENENIAFDWAYIRYASKIGLWQVGIMEDGAWGTKFADNARPEGKITWLAPFGPVVVGAQIIKLAENNQTALFTTTASDQDIDKYQGFVIYNFKGGSVGLLGVFQKFHEGGFIPPLAGTATDILGGDLYILMPYLKAKFGPVAIEAEVDYAWGKMKWDNIPGASSVKIDNLQAYVDAVADLGMFYVGGTLAFIDGDKQSTRNKIEGGILSGGRDWNPCLMMFNWDRFYWAGNIFGPTAPVVGTLNNGAPMSNAYFAQLRAGVRPVADLDIMASLSWAKAVRTPALNTVFATGNPAGVSIDLGNNKEYGYEVDVTATYRITNNLSYMLGGAYWFVGDFYKGLGETQKVQDNYLLINKLTLTF